MLLLPSGKATVSWMNEETRGGQRAHPARGHNPVAFIPDFELRTVTAARAALPATAARTVMRASNVARGALLAAVLSGGAQVSGGATCAPHGSYARPLIRNSAAAMNPAGNFVDWLVVPVLPLLFLPVRGPTAQVSGAGGAIRRDAAGAGWRTLLAVAASA